MTRPFVFLRDANVWEFHAIKFMRFSLHVTPCSHAPVVVVHSVDALVERRWHLQYDLQQRARSRRGGDGSGNGVIEHAGQHQHGADRDDA